MYQIKIYNELTNEFERMECGLMNKRVNERVNERMNGRTDWRRKELGAQCAQLCTAAQLAYRREVDEKRYWLRK